MPPKRHVIQQEELQVEGLTDEAAIAETESYLKSIAIGMGIDDLQIKHMKLKGNM